MIEPAALPAFMQQFTTTEPSMGDWQRATLGGNHALAHGDAQAALTQYRIALDSADALWGQTADPELRTEQPRRRTTAVARPCRHAALNPSGPTRRTPRPG